MEYNQEEYAAIEPDMAEGSLPSEQASEEDAEQVADTTEQSDGAVEGDENEIPEELPADPAKQREAFIKMRQQLRAQETRLKEVPQAPAAEEVVPPDDTLLDELLSYTPGGVVPQSRIDTSDEFGKAVSEHLTSAQAEARRATDRAAQLEGRLEKMEAESAYPTLKTDRAFRERVNEKLIYLTLKAQQEGKQRPTMAQVAKKVETEMGTSRSFAEKAGQEQARKSQQELENAALEARGSHANVNRSPADNPDRNRRINRGDENALTDSLLEGELSRFTEKDLGFY